MTSFGLLLPHFGGAVEPSRMVEGVLLAEALGFTSIWVRDHLVYEPHGFEPGDQSFLEAFTTLAYVAGQTRAMTVGTGAAIPTRHPLQLARGSGRAGGARHPRRDDVEGAARPRRP